MEFRPFGLGVGVILLILICMASILSCLIASQHRGPHFGILYIVLGALASVVLLVWPRSDCGVPFQPIIDKHLVDNDKAVGIDHMAIPRLVLAFILSIVAFLALAVYVKQKLLDPLHLKQKRNPAAGGTTSFHEILPKRPA